VTEQKLNTLKTEALANRVEEFYLHDGSFKAALKISRQLGARISGEDVNFCLWHPEIATSGRVFLLSYTPAEPIRFNQEEQHINFKIRRTELNRISEFAFGSLSGLSMGTKDQFGSFYSFIIVSNGEEKIVNDPMAYSMPYGIYAPAEIYDIETVLRNRHDKKYFSEYLPKILDPDTRRQPPSVNLLEIHTPTATHDGTLQGLTTLFKRIGSKIRNREKLTLFEKNFTGFDAVQLMPVEPVIQHPENHQFWKPVTSLDPGTENLTVKLSKSGVINWGYDIAIYGSAAINPSLLLTGRPDEFLELIETLHNFPGQPIRVVLDIVFGHADNQALNLLPDVFFTGPNMYGQDLNFQHPMVRAILLEMQRRKVNWGVDAIRVDGAQDFKYYNPAKDELVHDDEFLSLMSEVTQTACGIEYKPWMIFEDGRPWPREDWELASTYRDLIRQQDHCFQWAPMIFAYNTPYLFTFWMSKWWRVDETAKHGGRWISGYANHDTMRRGSQTDPSIIRVNTLLGNDLKEIMNRAYNNPSATLFMNAFMPGVPMDFVQALVHAPWSFIRNTDTEYAIKVAAEEAFFLHWQVNEKDYQNPLYFRNLKNLGFKTFKHLQVFTHALLRFIEVTEYNVPEIAGMLNNLKNLEVCDWSSESLNQFASAWMNDLHLYCNAENHIAGIHNEKTQFNLRVRNFRLKNPWLRSSFRGDDQLYYYKPVNATVTYYGYRKDLASNKEILFVANMEGQPRSITPSKLDLPNAGKDGWEVALATPGMQPRTISDTYRLGVSQGILFERLM